MDSRNPAYFPARLALLALRADENRRASKGGGVEILALRASSARNDAGFDYAIDQRDPNARRK